jgi:hypothetical protein
MPSYPLRDADLSALIGQLVAPRSVWKTWTAGLAFALVLLYCVRHVVRNKAKAAPFESKARAPTLICGDSDLASEAVCFFILPLPSPLA